MDYATLKLNGCTNDTKIQDRRKVTRMFSFLTMISQKIIHVIDISIIINYIGYWVNRSTYTTSRCVLTMSVQAMHYVWNSWYLQRFPVLNNAWSKIAWSATPKLNKKARCIAMVQRSRAGSKKLPQWHMSLASGYNVNKVHLIWE